MNHLFIWEGHFRVLKIRHMRGAILKWCVCRELEFEVHIESYRPSISIPQDIVIPESYPFQPVKMKFATKVYHPNVSSASGAICLDILKDAWSPVLTLKSTMISLQSLLCSPEPSDPQDAEVAKHYMTSKSGFEDTARYWTQTYAGGPGLIAKSESSGKDEVAIAGLERAHVDRFEALGFPRGKVVSQVSSSCWLFDWQICRSMLSVV